MTTTNPSVVVEARAATENFATSVWLLDSSVVGPIDERSFEAPIILTTTKLEGSGRSSDHVNLACVRWAGFDDRDGDIGIFGETSGDGVTGRAT
jgi:hypothetical protein